MENSHVLKLQLDVNLLYRYFATTQEIDLELEKSFIKTLQVFINDSGNQI